MNRQQQQRHRQGEGTATAWGTSCALPYDPWIWDHGPVEAKTGVFGPFGDKLTYKLGYLLVVPKICDGKIHGRPTGPIWLPGENFEMGSKMERKSL